MSIWLEVGLALLLAYFIFWLWAYFVQEYGLTKVEKKFVKRNKGIDSIGVAVTLLCHDGHGNYISHKGCQTSFMLHR